MFMFQRCFRASDKEMMCGKYCCFYDVFPGFYDRSVLEPFLDFGCLTG